MGANLSTNSSNQDDGAGINLGSFSIDYSISLPRAQDLQNDPKLINAGDDFNNLPQALPGGAKRSELTGGWSSKVLVNSLCGEDLSDKENAEHSEVWKNQTYGQFGERVDRILTDLGLDLTEIEARLWELKQHSKNSATGRVLSHKLKVEVLIPLYLELRRAGYTHMEVIQ